VDSPDIRLRQRAPKVARRTRSEPARNSEAGGFVVEPCNPKAMAEALATILLDGPMRSEMAEVMRRRVASYYHKDRVTRLYEGLYADLTAQPAPLADLESHDQHQYHH